MLQPKVLEEWNRIESFSSDLSPTFILFYLNRIFFFGPRLDFAIMERQVRSARITRKRKMMIGELSGRNWLDPKGLHYFLFYYCVKSKYNEL